VHREKSIMKNDIYIHERALIIGRVTIGRFSSVLPNTVLRGDLADIEVGRYSNIQDNCVAHSDMWHYVRVGDFVTVGHGAVIHGTDVGDCCIVGMHAVLMNGSKIGRGSIVAAGTLIKEKMEVPPFSLAVGNPAVIKENRYKGYITPIESALIYYYLTRCYLSGRLPDREEVKIIYGAARREAENLDGRIASGEDVSALADAVLPMPFDC